MKQSKASFWVYAFCFFTFAAFGWYGFSVDSKEVAGTSELASKGAFENAEQCGPARNYFLKDLKKMSAVYAGNRSQAQVSRGNPPKECVSFIMQNFIPLNSKSTAMSQCRNEEGQALLSPTKGADAAGFQPPCVTESYVNSVYNSLVDVGDCLNIPVKELLPKLYNESGLHVNTLGGGFDAGVGQLTVSALREVFMRYDGISTNPSALDWYVKEIAKSNKESCKRIIAEKSAYQIDVPKGQKLCFSGEASDADCYTPWSSSNRCIVMTMPANPLKNVLFTGIFYRSMLKNATGISFSAGNDTINGRAFRDGEDYNGYIGAGNFVERLRKLGATHASSAVIKQMIVSLGFNAGIRSGKIYLENFIKQREAKQKYLKDADVDFQNVSTGKWAIVTNLPTYWRGLGSDDAAEFDKAMTSLEVLRELGLDANKAQKTYKELRPYVQKEVKAINDNQKLSAEDKQKKINELKVKYDKYRHPLLQAVFAKSDELTLPEYMRIAHAYSIITDTSAGGAPGYLSFVAAKHKQLEKEMGARVCTADQYLQF
ncbi:hypothetical protein [uncultured Bdellovibrio sp.]|uniref:hypothetical protein n=1 Tax=Bdellovibrio sp. HCB-162 TaxID=3394234 RepID=UPI0025F5F9E4|nr:hypothetical protein [uncultured Bdellovibrio sp.]